MSDHAGLTRVQARAAVDAGYRRRLLDAPQEAIEEVLGPAPAGGVRIGFVDKPADVDVLVVLPDAVSATEALTLEELEALLSAPPPTEDTAAGSDPAVPVPPSP